MAALLMAAAAPPRFMERPQHNPMSSGREQALE
jgi:hypothetical protein